MHRLFWNCELWLLALLFKIFILSYLTFLQLHHYLGSVFLIWDDIMWLMKELFFCNADRWLSSKQVLAYRFQPPPHNLDHHVSRGDNKAMPVLPHTAGTGNEWGSAGAELRACGQNRFPWSCVFHQPSSKVSVQVQSWAKLQISRSPNRTTWLKV